MNLTVSQKAKLYTVLTVIAAIAGLVLLSIFPAVIGMLFIIFIMAGCVLLMFWAIVPLIYESFEDWLKEKQAWKDIENKVEPVTDIPQADIDFVKGLIENFSPVEIKALKFVLEKEEL